MLGGAEPLVKLLVPKLDLNLVDAPEPLGTSHLKEKEEHSAYAWMLLNPSLTRPKTNSSTVIVFKSKINQLFHKD